MADMSTQPKKKSSAKRYPHGFPRDPKKLGEIIYLRDKENMSWRRIGEKLGTTGQAPYLLYRYWILGQKPPKKETKDDPS